MNEIKQQWIVRRKYLLGGDSIRLIVKTEDNRYFMSNGEVGEYTEINYHEARKMIDREIPKK